NSDQDADDDHDHQQFDEGETPLALGLAGPKLLKLLVHVSLLDSLWVLGPVAPETVLTSRSRISGGDPDVCVAAAPPVFRCVARPRLTRAGGMAGVVAGTTTPDWQLALARRRSRTLPKFVPAIPVGIATVAVTSPSRLKLSAPDRSTPMPRPHADA